MKRLILGLSGALVVLIMTGCATVVAPVNGMFYGDVKWGGTATSNSGSQKVGKAMCKTYLGAFSQGDASIQAAAQSAGITKIHHVDYHSRNIWVLYGEFTVTVYGE